MRERLRLLWILPAIPGLYQLALLLSAVFHRWSYPYDLEWMEGGMLVHALRLSHGHTIYPPPSIDFIPYLYTPLYPAILAVLGKIFGLGYKLGRGISILAILGVVGAGAVGLWRETERKATALVGATVFAGFFAATYPWVEGWYDLVRGDTLFLAIGVVGLVLLRAWAHRGWKRVAIAGALLALSFFAKQTGILLVAGGGAALLVMNRRAITAYVVSAGAVGGLGSLLLNTITHGWYWIYVFKIHQQHDTNKDRFFKSFKFQLWHFPAMTCVVVGTLLVVAGLAIARRPIKAAARNFLYWSWLFACGIVIGALGWATQWAHFNAYIPAMTFGALACGAALPVLAEETELAAGAVALVCGIGLWHARWKPARFEPTAADRAAGDKLIAHIASIPGEVYVPSHPWYAVLAAKQPYTHRMGILDVSYEPMPTEGKEKLPARVHFVEGLRDSLKGHRFAAIVMDDHMQPYEFNGLVEGYRIGETLPPDESPRVYTGATTSPHTIWVPKETPAPMPAGAKMLWDFEVGQKDWTSNGQAWGTSPTTDVPGHLVTNLRGSKFVSSFHAGEKTTGTLLSPAFPIEGSKLTFRIAGGADPEKLRVELRVAGRVVRQATGPGQDAMQVVEWDLTDLKGESAQLALVDESTTGWIAVDDIEELP